MGEQLSPDQLQQLLDADASPVVRAAVRRLWLQGRPVYEKLDGRRYAWWPDGRLEPTDGSGPSYFADTTRLKSAQPS